MQLTMYTDYSLRVLMYLGRHQSEQTTIEDIVDYYSVSRNHLTKVVHNLAVCGFVRTTRGRKGGIALLRKPSDINVRDVVLNTEKNFNIVECLQSTTSSCTVEDNCHLRHVFQLATDQFLNVLEDYTLADLIKDGSVLDFKTMIYDKWARIPESV